ncbi:MAG TPA: dNTP triphosphohydrolase, partial [Verrucomicrobiota bacterium]|nr:dNTP triphosphohydrolase [Verrucomicrobiota bacterium]
MPISRRQLEEREQLILAPYAQLSSQTRGRKYSEPPPELRTHFQRDRDRVIHSRAFRRLEYKTQVFLNGTGDHLRTRLTHTMEVAAISRNIARALKLNEDLAETIALAHDLGHSPFGHNGEKALNQLMKDHGGFEHNLQSLRIVELLEQKYPSFPGLNLTWEVREGLAKHSSAYDNPPLKLDTNHKFPSLEAQVANIADEVAYYSHDLDDGLETGLLNEDKLKKEVKIFADTYKSVRKQFPNLSDECRRHFIIRCIIDHEVNEIVET